MAQEAQYRISTVQENDKDDVIKLLRRTFFVDEPMNKAVGLCASETDTCRDVEEYCTSALTEGLSFKATDNEDNIVGVIINGVCPIKEDAANDLIQWAERCENPKFQKILYVLAQRESGAKIWERFPHEQRMVDVKVAATDRKWRRKGIMNALMKATEKDTLERNISLIRIDTSSAYSAMSAEHFGYTCIYSARYTDIKMDGRPLIVPEAPHYEDRVYVKLLTEPQV